MKVLALLLVLPFGLLAPAATPEPPTALEAGFAQPPARTKPWCYWYWISDNISRDGITRDLEAMARVGIGEAFVGNVFLDDVPAGSTKVLTPEWWALVEHAIREAGRVGVDLGLFNCPGWSQSGGPWIRPEQSMRHLALSETRVVGPRPLEERLPVPKEPFQDVALVAFPAPAHDRDTLRTRSPNVTALPSAPGVERLLDGDLRSEFRFPAGAASGSSTFTLDFAVSEPFTARSLQLTPGTEPFGAECELLATDETGAFRSVRRFRADRSNPSLGVGFLPRGPVAVSFPATTATRFRLVFSGTFAGGARPALAEIELSAAARLEAYVEKQLGKMHPTPLPMWDTYLWRTQAEPDTAQALVPRDRILDLTPSLGADGVLKWQVPPGDWVIQRVGMAPTGMKNAPASPEGQGLEVDKMNRTLARYHFDAFIGEVVRRLPAADRKAFRHVVADSYEMGSQNWTDGFGDAFRRRYGYDPVKWLPVLGGRLVDSADASERFLWDLRRLVADRVATDYVGGLREACRAHGLELWLENYGHWGFPGEFLQYGGESDRVGGEYWVTGDLGSIECRAAASCANTYGKPFVSAESFTGGPAFRNAPRALAARGNWAFCEGVNHFVLHVYIHQPREDRTPGINTWFGTEFNRHNTWFDRSRSWIDYLRRCCWLLQQGNRVADVAYFIGEDAPKMTGPRTPDLPPGRDFDFVNAEVIETRLAVRDGTLTLPHGTTYQILVLPQLDTMRPEVLRKVRDLVRDGGTVLGPPPSRSPSLENHPRGDDEVRALAAELWGGADTRQPGQRAFGKGRIAWGLPLDTLLASRHAPPDFESALPLRFTHRRQGDTEIYFVANPTDEPLTTTPAFRAGPKAPELWWPDSGRIERPATYDVAGDVVRLPVSLGPQGAVFVVFRSPTAPAGQRVRSITRNGRELPGTRPGSAPPIATTPDPALELVLLDGQLTARAAEAGTYELVFADGRPHRLEIPAVPAPRNLEGPWEIRFAPGWGAPERTTFDTPIDWTRHPDPGIRHYSGTAHYRFPLELPASALPQNSDRRLVLDLGDVRDLATVRLNGRDLGTRWLPPWRWDVTDAARPGVNELEIEVVNVWNNRLVGDAALPADKRRTSLTAATVAKDTPLLPAGLLGPVRVLTRRIVAVPGDHP